MLGKSREEKRRVHTILLFFGPLRRWQCTCYLGSNTVTISDVIKQILLSAHSVHSSLLNLMIPQQTCVKSQNHHSSHLRVCVPSLVCVSTTSKKNKREEKDRSRSCMCSLLSHLSSLISHLSSLISHLSSLISHLSLLLSLSPSLPLSNDKIQLKASCLRRILENRK